MRPKKNPSTRSVGKLLSTSLNLLNDKLNIEQNVSVFAEVCLAHPAKNDSSPK